ILDGEFIAVKENEALHRTVANALMNSKAAPEDLSPWAAIFVFDILKYDGKDLRDLPLSERLKYLAKLSRFDRIVVEQPSEKLDGKHPAYIVRSDDEMEKAIDLIRDSRTGIWEKAAEGVVVKRLDHSYEAPQNRGWAKMKWLHEADVVVLTRKLVKGQTDVWNYELGINISEDYAHKIPVQRLACIDGDEAYFGPEAVQRFGKQGVKWFMRFGKSDNTKLDLRVGDVLRVAPEEVLEEPNEENPDYPVYRGYISIALEPVPEKDRSDDLMVFERLAEEEPQRISIEELRRLRQQSLEKAKIYLRPGEHPPPGYPEKRGPKGGRYYETREGREPQLKPYELEERAEGPLKDYSRKYHFRPETFDCLKEDLPLVSNLVLKYVPLLKLHRRNGQYSVELECNRWTRSHQRFFTALKNAEIRRAEAYKDSSEGDLRRVDVDFSAIWGGFMPIGCDRVELDTSLGHFRIRQAPDRQSLRFEYRGSKKQLGQLASIFAEEEPDLDQFLGSLLRSFQEVNIGTEEEAKNWADAWVSNTGGFVGVVSRVVTGLRHGFSLAESAAVSFEGAPPTPASSVIRLQTFHELFKDRERVARLRRTLAGLKRLYRDTQDFLKEDKRYKNKDFITVYRGVGPRHAERIFGKDLKENEIWIPPISSWTEDPKIAAAFAEHYGGEVLVAKVPKSWVLAHWRVTPGYYQSEGVFYNPRTGKFNLKTQKEVTLLAPSNKIKCEKILKY
ncbi:MAG: ATP-dependent DNA ligase, partial [Methanosarcinales archaeon]